MWVWGTGQLSTLLCSSASDSDCRGTRVGRVRPSGSTGDLVAASLGCAQALRCLRGCAEVTPLWRQRWGPGSPPPATYVWHGCRTPHRAALALVLPPARSLPRLSRNPLPDCRMGRQGVCPGAPEPRADPERSAGPGGQPRPGRCRLRGLPASSPPPSCPFPHVCGWARVWPAGSATFAAARGVFSNGHVGSGSLTRDPSTGSTGSEPLDQQAHPYGPIYGSREHLPRLQKGRPSCPPPSRMG